MQAEVFDKDGQNTGRTIELPDEVFGVEPNDHVVYLVVKAQMANRRQGTHKTKVRSAVRGGGRKPWRQKGRGVARAGTIRSPLWVGGGRVFGPTPRSYSQSVNKKVKKLARKSVLSSKLKNNEVTIVEDFTIESGKTREMVSILKRFEAENAKCLLLTSDRNEMLFRASRNLYKLNMQVGPSVSTYELLNCRRLFIQESAVSKIVEVLQS